MMGGGPPSETLLFLHSRDEPRHITDSIRTRFPYIDLIYHRCNSSEDVPESLWTRATILVTFSILPPKPQLVPRMKWIQLLSAGIDHIVDRPIFKDTDIAITTASGIHTPAISEWVLMTSLCLTKNYNKIHENQQDHKWDSGSIGLSKRRDWYGRTIGVVGYGSIGRQVAHVFKAMGCKIHVFTASSHPDPASRRHNGYVIPGTGDPDGTIPDNWYSGKERKDLHHFLSSGLDLVLLSVPLTPATRHLFGAEEFDVLFKTSLDRAKHQSPPQTSAEGRLPDGEGCIVSNISRGAVIDQAALIAALREGKLAGATLDVTDPEPLPESSELWNLPNVVITPHLSGNFAGYLERVFDVVAENLKRRERGEEMVNLVKRERGY